MAGSLSYSWRNGYTYDVKLAIYSNVFGAATERCEDTLCFGDATSAIVFRSNGPIGGCSPVHEGVLISPSVKYSEYVTSHTFAGSGSYIFCYEANSRDPAIINIPNAENTNIAFHPFLNIPTFTSGKNSNPTFSILPLDTGCIGQIFFHNPLASDIDGDSLSYSIVASQTSNGVATGYAFPSGTFSIDPVSGQVSWQTPAVSGNYNFVILVREYRKDDDGNYFIVGSVERETNVFIKACSTNIYEESQANGKADIYPNPVNDILKIMLNNFDDSPACLTIKDISGRIIIQKENIAIYSNKNEFNLNVSDLTNGMYFLHLNQKGNLATIKFIKQ